MKSKIEYMKQAEMEKKIIKDNDRLRYKIERFKRAWIFEKYSENNGLKKLGPGDFTVLKINENIK